MYSCDNWVNIFHAVHNLHPCKCPIDTCLHLWNLEPPLNIIYVFVFVGANFRKQCTFHSINFHQFKMPLDLTKFQSISKQLFYD